MSSCASSSAPVVEYETVSERHARLTGAYTCARCLDRGFFRDARQLGDPLFGKLSPCPDCSRRAEVNKAKLIAASRLKPGTIGLSLDHIYARGEGSNAMISEVKRLIDQPYGILTVYGGPGNGKSLALQVAVNAWLDRGLTARYYRMIDLLDELRAGFDEHSKLSESQLYAAINAVDLLAIDELDKPRLTPYAQEVMFRLIDDRYIAGRPGMDERRRHTIIAMNHHPDQLPAYLLSRMQWGLSDPDGFRIVYNSDSDAREVGL